MTPSPIVERGTWSTHSLPQGWAWENFDRVFENVTSSDRKLKREKYAKAGQYPVIDQGEELIGGYSDDANLVQTATPPFIVFGDHTRCVKYVPYPFVQGADGVKVLKARECDPSFLLWALRTLRLPDRGYSRHFQFLRNSVFPIAPLPEQRRIVAKIEEMFSDLGAGVAALERVRVNLKRYRAAVLKAAVEGRLTAEWRKRNPDVEPASKLLERILTERRAKWEQDQLRKFKEAGKTPPKGWKEKYEEPSSPQAPFPFQLPSSWLWAGSLQLCTSIESGSTPPPDEMQAGRGEVPFIKVYNLTFTGALDFTVKPTFIARETHYGKLNRSRAIPGDVLMNIVGPPLGKVSIVPDLYPEWNTNQAIASFRAGPGILNRYLATCLLADPVLRWITSQAKATAGQHNISVSMSRALPLPLPPLAEQAEIVAEVDRRLSVADAAEQQVEHALQRAARLRQAILKRAFEGKLVPQDPTDVPAATLVERAKAPANSHREVIETSGTPRRDTPKRRSRARA